MKISLENTKGFLNISNIEAKRDTVYNNIKSLEDKTGKGNDFLGWVNLPSKITTKELEDIKITSDKIRQKIDILVVIGIGGSYLGAKAVIDALSDSFSHIKNDKKNPIVIFAGQNICSDYHTELLELLDNHSYAINIISKSGTTTEPALAFRFLKEHIEKKYGKDEAKTRIIAITDKKSGALKKLSDKEGYKTFVIPDDIGGRYSVLTPVGLLPIAIAGFDIEKLIDGAKQMELETASNISFEENAASQYAAARYELYKSGKTTEILVSYTPKLQYFSEWWKQLFGESEGKENKGIFPASVNFTSDLHSMGQYIQEGQRNLFETVISVENTKHDLLLNNNENDLDGLNYLSGKSVNYINKMAEKGTIMAHIDGGVPNIHISIPKLDEYNIGQLIYFFEKACAIGGYLLDVNPFDQPGVEAYKKNMFKLLGKAGY